MDKLLFLNVNKVAHDYMDNWLAVADLQGQYVASIEIRKGLVEMKVSKEVLDRLDKFIKSIEDQLPEAQGSAKEEEK
jgi:hypothetical protein